MDQRQRRLHGMWGLQPELPYGGFFRRGRRGVRRRSYKLYAGTERRAVLRPDGILRAKRGSEEIVMLLTPSLRLSQVLKKRLRGEVSPPFIIIRHDVFLPETVFATHPLLEGAALAEPLDTLRVLIYTTPQEDIMLFARSIEIQIAVFPRSAHHPGIFPRKLFNVHQ